MKVAVVGAGKWGMNLVRTLHELGALGAVVEANPAAHDAIREVIGELPIYDQIGPVLESNLNAVVIATPGPTHFAVAQSCLEAGKDVFVEKPMVLDSREGEILVQLAREKGRILMVGHLLIYQPAIRWIREQLQAGLIGPVKSFHQERLNLGRARRVENVLWSIGVHDVAVALYLVGAAPTHVEAMGQCVLQPSVEDDAYVHMEFAGGMQAHLHTSWLWPVRRRVLNVIGEKGMLVYDEEAQTVTLHRKTIDQALNNVDEGSEVVFNGAGKPLTLEMEHFLHCVQTRVTPVSDGQSAVEVLRVIERATQAEPTDADSQPDVENLVTGASR